MFGLRTKAAPKMQRIVDAPWFDETVRMRERLKSHHFSRNPEINEYLQHSIGVAHNCACTNATVCTSGVIRLYKRTGARTERTRMFRGGKVIGTKTVEHKAMRQGRYGRKLAEFTRGGAQMQEVESHAILDFMSNPNPSFPGEELTWQDWYYAWVTGTAYDKIQSVGNTPVAAWPLYAQFVQVSVNDQDELRFVYGRSDQQWGDYGEDEVIQIKLRPNPHTPLYGMGAMHGILPWVDLIKDTLVHNIALSKNGMRMDGIVSLPEGTSDEQEKSFMKRIESKFRGVKNWYNWLVVTGPVDFKTQTFTEKDIMSIEKEDRAERLIRNAFGVTDSMNSSDDATYAGALVGFNDQYLGGVIEPALQYHAAQLNTKLLWRFGLDQDVYSLAYDPMVIKDDKIEVETLLMQTDRGLMTLNEARQERGLPTVPDENADKLLYNGQPLGAQAQPDPFGGLLGGFGGSAPKDEPEEQGSTEEASNPPGSGDTDDSEPETAKSNVDFKSIVHDLESPLWNRCDDCHRTKDDDDIAANDPVLKEALRKYMGGVESLAREVVADMQDEALGALADGRTPDLSERVQQSAPMFRDAMSEIVKFGITNYLESGDHGQSVPDDAFNIVPERALRALDAYSFELAGELADTTVRMTETAVRNGLEQGWSIDKVADEMAGFPEYRAEAIARTETQRAVQTGKREGAISVGVKEHRILTAPGVRTSHAEIAKQGFIPIDEPFVKAGETFGGETFNRDLYAPPLGVNCRCGVTFKYEGE